MWSPSFRRALFYLPLCFLGGEALLHLLQVVAGRIDYPYELEWMEGGMLHQVLRVLHGEPLYGKPSLDFIPALYMPLYYYLSALSASIVGENLYALRIVSVAATFITHVLVFLIVRKMGGSRLAALLGVLFYASMFSHTGFWFDVARVDSLWTMLLATTFYVLLSYREKQTTGRLLVFAQCGVLAFFTKQATLFLLPFVAVTFCCWFGWRHFVRFVVCCVPLLFLLGMYFLFTEEHFLFYTMQMAGSHGVTLFGVRRFFEIVIQAVPFFWVAGLVACCVIGNHRLDRLGWIALFAGFIFVSGLSRAYAGAFYNVLMPLYFCLSITAALGFGWLVEKSETSRIAAMAVVFLLAGIFLNILYYRFEPSDQLPRSASKAATDMLVRQIAAVPGAVCVTSHGYLAWLAGKDFCAHNTQVTDLVTGSDPALAQVLRDDARQKILSGYYRVIILDRKKELADLGLQFDDIPYTVQPIDYWIGEPIRFPVNGNNPELWLEYKEEKRYAR
jgi:hypothetical protein